MTSKKEKLVMYQRIRQEIKGLKHGGRVVFGGVAVIDPEQPGRSTVLAGGHILIEAEQHDHCMMYLVDDYYMSRVPEIAAIVFREAVRRL